MGIPEEAGQLLSQARSHEQDGDLAKAEACYQTLLSLRTDQVDALIGLSALALGRGDRESAEKYLTQAHRAHPDHEDAAKRLATLFATGHRIKEAQAVLESLLSRDNTLIVPWLLLSELRNRQGDASGSLKASFQAVTRAQAEGQWRDEASTPRPLVPLVLGAIERLRTGRRELLFGSYEEVRKTYGNNALIRIDKALRIYLKEEVCEPPNTRQRPTFFYIPDLPERAYYDPQKQPWASRLVEAFPQIKREAISVLEEEANLPDFLRLASSDSARKYLGGDSLNPAWKAFFFYRRGHRYVNNHLRCPVSSHIIDSLDLCRIPNQAPEICFSIIRPKTLLKAHHGVTNARLVMHLPLLIPKDCHLNLIGVGEHQWREGELVMFDDTYLHEARNDSNQPRIVLLMDCWNPELTVPEREAFIAITETLSALHPEIRMQHD